MNRFFSLDTPIMVFLGKLADLVVLNLLFLLCSIPVVTVGASWTALCYAVRKLQLGEGYAIKNFFSALKDNVKQALLVTLVLAAVGGFLFLDWTLLSNDMLPVPEFFRIFLITFALLYWMVICLTFPLISRFENTWQQTLKNALFMGLRHFPRLLLVMIVFLIPFALFVLRPDLFFNTLLIWIFAGFALIAWVGMQLLEGMFRKYISEEA